jgi:molybdopterin molybdotransferase
VLEALGVRKIFYQVAQRPGMPMYFGIGKGGQAVFGLPGNPVATLTLLVRYVVPATAFAMGTRPRTPERISLAESVSFGRAATTYFLPVSIDYGGLGHAVAIPRRPNGPGDFLALTLTDGFVELPPRPEPFPEGFGADLYRW